MPLRKPTLEPHKISQRADPVAVLRETSRTFYFSIIDLPPRLREAVMSAYLSLRAIDEIEDHPQLDKLTKIGLLREISSNGQSFVARGNDRLSSVLDAYRDELPEVTNRLGEWIALAPKDIAPQIWNASAAMAWRMADWVDNEWRIRTKADLDCYTFSVAGVVGLLLSDLWVWHDGTHSHRGNAVGFGRGLQAVNILRNRAEDIARGVDLFPDGWNESELQSYARANLSLADEYVERLPPGPASNFCRIPLSLAYATLDALARGEPKLTRSTVMEIVGKKSSAQNRERTES